MKRKPPKGKSFAEVNPELVDQWHPTKNGDLTPFDVFASSKNKAWWKCDKGDDHEWETKLENRSQGYGCSICSGSKIVKSNCLATLNPELAKEWHPTKNGELTPYDVRPFMHKKVWWKCDKGDDHQWISRISDRSNHNSCPICANLKIVKSNCLATLHPELAKEWHPTKNEGLTPYEVGVGASLKVWWKCGKGDDHEWEATVVNRKKGSDCSICSNLKIVKSNCLATLNPELAKEWHPTKNEGLTPNKVGVGASLKVWWKCDKGDDHEWEATVVNRKKGRGCPICSNRKISQSNNFLFTHPQLSKEWHPTKNGKLTPNDVVAGTPLKVWWTCVKGVDHEWEAGINTRTKQKVGCPVCSNKKVVLSNSLAITHPELAKEWHPIKNGELSPYNLVVGSSFKVWWKCDKGSDHEWKAILDNRKRGTDCPYCTLTPQSKQELTITFELLMIFKDINPRGFKTRIDGKLWTIDIYIPKFHLGIEFDGSYWHKEKRALDKLKTEQLNEEGFDIIRVREKPLEKIFDTDVISSLPYNGKKITDDVLRQIMEMKKIDGRKLKQINNYLTKEGLQNQKGLDQYIDLILTEKANK